jgi:3,4-dihydroxy 2-butanone 4-phosphate synthase/GTP cyclohydrolase II
VLNILDDLVINLDLKRLEFLLAEGDDPMLGLQVNLARQNLARQQEPSKIAKELERQIIYSFG